MRILLRPHTNTPTRSQKHGLIIVRPLACARVYINNESVAHGRGDCCRQIGKGPLRRWWHPVAFAPAVMYKPTAGAACAVPAVVLCVSLSVRPITCRGSRSTLWVTYVPSCDVQTKRGVRSWLSCADGIRACSLSCGCVVGMYVSFLLFLVVILFWRANSVQN